jgi:DAK2 domain fusion protein YloV
MTRRSGNGAGLMGAFRVAVENLERHVDEVNALNVFPVPDGDTGSNMLATVKAALAQAESQADLSADRVAQAISFGALMGARGNSGVIASQIFRGMADALGGKDRFDGSDLARALNQGTATAYKAVGKPVEGTILTVIREAAAAAVVSAEVGGDLEVVLTAAVEAAREAVAKTPSLLPVLRDAGVVDAGGEGLYRLMQGTLQYLVARTRVERRRASQPPPQVGTTGGAEGYGYETMFLLQGGAAPVDVDRLRAELDAMGDSVLVAGDSRAVRVHVHNARPDQVIALGLSMGSLTRITVENLDAQSDEVREQKAAEVVGAHIEVRPRATHQDGRPHVELETFGAEVTVSGGDEGANGSAGSDGTGGDRGLDAVAPLAVVAVAAGEGMARIFHSFGVAAVVHGGQAANPSTGELLDAVEKIDAEEVLLLPNNPNVILAARQASELTTRRVRVVPTRNAAEGFAALLALDPDRDATANAEVMTLAGRAVQTLQVTEAVRDATIGDHKVRKGQTIVLDPDDGLLAVGGNRLKAMLGALAALEPGFELVTLYYGAGVDRSEAEEAAARIVKWRPGLEVEVIEGDQPHYRYLIAAE